NKVAGSLHITGNTVDNPDFPAACSGTTACGQGISVSAETSAGSLSPNNSTLCADIGNGGANTVNGAWNGFDIRVQALRTSTFKVAGWNGSPANDPTAFIISKNTGSDAVVVGKSNGSTNPGTFTGDGTACSPLLFGAGGVNAAASSQIETAEIGAQIDTFGAGASDDFALFRNLPRESLGSVEVSERITPAFSPVTSSLTQEQLDATVNLAISRWAVTGLSASQIAALRAIDFRLDDLAGSYLGEVEANRIVIDR